MLYRLHILLLVLTSALAAFSTDRALLVGIGAYDTQRTGWSRLHGDRDVDLLKAGLISNGFSTSDIVTLKNNQATKRAIVDALSRLANICKPGDRVYFHFSGHGQPVTDINGDERARSGSEFEQSIVPYDAFRSPRYKIGDRFYQAENHILDDELNPLLNAIKVKIGKKGHLFVTIDACFSQGIEMAEATTISAEEWQRVGPARGTAQKFKVDRSAYLASIPRPKKFSPGGRMTIVAACKSTERNFEYKVSEAEGCYGSLSYYISLLLKTDANFARWERAFLNKEYEQAKVFISEQHPVITIY
jgi:hypothetical protein